MVLSNDQIKEIVKSPLHQEEIQRGIHHQSRLRFHTDTVLKKSDFDNAYSEFTNWVGRQSPELLPQDKFKRFLQLLKPPFPTNELVESIYSRLYRVFFSQDNFFHYEFTSPELAGDWNSFRNDTFWANAGFQAMQTAIDSVWVVDLPETQMTPRPAPFDRLIDISNVIDIENDENNNCQYLIYRMGDWIVAYDDQFIRVFQNRAEIPVGAKTRSTQLSMIDISDPYKEIVHGLGFTPAKMFWNKSLSSQNFINKSSPLTKVLSDLDWLLFHMISKKYMDISNAYPILVKYESDRDYADEDDTENKDRPEGGKRPAGNKMIGAGSYIEVPPPVDNSDPDLMRSAPVMLISPEVDTLEWHVNEEKRLKDTIFKSVVGTDTEVRNDSAKNEMQMEASFESQKSVLFHIKRNFEIIHKFADYTKAKLRYGDQFIDCKIDYGTEFFLKTVEDLHEDRQKAKESGAGEIVLSNITDKILNTEYKEDIISRKRAEVIRDLDPMPEKNDIEEIIKIYENGGIDKINFIIKTNLLKFVRRFERENISLAEFAKNLDYNEKINLITEKFKNYANESEQGSASTD